MSSTFTAEPAPAQRGRGRSGVLSPPGPPSARHRLLTLGLLAGALFVTSIMPVAGLVLLVQWAFGTALRPPMSALVLSLLLAYGAVLWLAVQGGLPLPSQAAVALLLALSLALCQRMNLQRMVTALERRIDRLEARCAEDELTGVFSSRHILELAARELDRARRNARSFALLLVAIDDLTAINEHLGDASGNEALRFVADTLRQGIRMHDAVGRVAGNRFLVLLVEADADAAWQAALRLQAAFANQDVTRGGDHSPLQISIGLAYDSLETLTLPALMDRAERALQGAKAARRHHRPVPGRQRAG